jgi:hypothetical protein
MNKDTINKEIKEYEKEITKLKKLLETPEAPKKQLLIESIKSISDVYKELKRKELTIEDFSFLPENRRKKALAFQQIQDICELFAEGWVINWDNRSQYKYYPYFYKENGSWLVAHVAYYYYRSSGGPGFYKDEKTVKHCSTLFLEIYRTYLNN